MDLNALRKLSREQQGSASTTYAATVALVALTGLGSMAALGDSEREVIVGRTGASAVPGGVGGTSLAAAGVSMNSQASAAHAEGSTKEFDPGDAVGPGFVPSAEELEEGGGLWGRIVEGVRDLDGDAVGPGFVPSAEELEEGGGLWGRIVEGVRDLGERFGEAVGPGLVPGVQVNEGGETITICGIVGPCWEVETDTGRPKPKRKDKDIDVGGVKVCPIIGPCWEIPGEPGPGDQKSPHEEDRSIELCPFGFCVEIPLPHFGSDGDGDFWEVCPFIGIGLCWEFGDERKPESLWPFERDKQTAELREGFGDAETRIRELDEPVVTTKEAYVEESYRFSPDDFLLQLGEADGHPLSNVGDVLDPADVRSTRGDFKLSEGSVRVEGTYVGDGDGIRMKLVVVGADGRTPLEVTIDDVPFGADLDAVVRRELWQHRVLDSPSGEGRSHWSETTRLRDGSWLSLDHRVKRDGEGAPDRSFSGELRSRKHEGIDVYGSSLGNDDDRIAVHVDGLSSDARDARSLIGHAQAIEGAFNDGVSREEQEARSLVGEAAALEAEMNDGRSSRPQLGGPQPR